VSPVSCRVSSLSLAAYFLQPISCSLFLVSRVSPVSLSLTRRVSSLSLVSLVSRVFIVFVASLVSLVHIASISPIYCVFIVCIVSFISIVSLLFIVSFISLLFLLSLVSRVFITSRVSILSFVYVYISCIHSIFGLRVCTPFVFFLVFFFKSRPPLLSPFSTRWHF